MGILASIASAVAPPLINGLFGGGDKKRTTETTVNLVKLRAQAEKAGFNPLTALKTVGSGFTSSTSTVPGLSTREVLGNALGAGLETWFNRDEIAQQEELERVRLETMRAQLEEARTRIDWLRQDQPFGHTIPSYETASGDGIHGPESAALTPGGNPQGAAQGPMLNDSVDGLPTANPDTATDAETDMWQWLRDGSFFRNTEELWRRNVGMPTAPGLAWDTYEDLRDHYHLGQINLGTTPVLGPRGPWGN